MRLIPVGRLRRRQPEVSLAAYCIDELETTVARYRECVHARRCKREAHDSTCFNTKRPNSPIACATFEDAAAYCAFHGGRLPTPNEWVRAASGDKESKHPWGDDIRTPPGGVCWGRTFEQGPCDVGTTPTDVSAFGVRDMAGNVAEWTRDPAHEGKGQLRFELILGYSWTVDRDDVLIRMVGSATAEHPGTLTRDGGAGVRCVSAPTEVR
jgi:formylglycine-generating enzyme required for sulfatase activity